MDLDGQVVTQEGAEGADDLFVYNGLVFADGGIHRIFSDQVLFNRWGGDLKGDSMKA